MPNQKFWILNSLENVADLADWVPEDVLLETVKCPANQGHQRAGRRLTDLSVRLPRALRDDFIWTWGNTCLMQDHVLRIFQGNGFRGFDAKPVKAVFSDNPNSRSPQLWELIVTGWAGIAPQSSGIKLVERCDACQHTHYSPLIHPDRLIDEDGWDGGDFFMVWPLPKIIFVTDRVADTIRAEKWTGSRISRISDMPIGKSGFSPGRLSYVMPVQRARQLGEALGIF